MIKKVKSNKNNNEIHKEIKYALNLLSNKKQLKFITITNTFLSVNRNKDDYFNSYLKSLNFITSNKLINNFINKKHLNTSSFCFVIEYSGNLSKKDLINFQLPKSFNLDLHIHIIIDTNISNETLSNQIIKLYNLKNISDVKIDEIYNKENIKDYLTKQIKLFNTFNYNFVIQ